MKRTNNLRRWYDTISVGILSGNPPVIQPVGPDQFIHFADKSYPLRFKRHCGTVYTLDFNFLTDLGTIPPKATLLSRYLTKTYYIFAFLFHDPKYDLQVWPELTFEENNLMCIEIIKTLQQVGYLGRKYKGGAAVANYIYTGISTSRKSYEENNSYSDRYQQHLSTQGW